MALKCAVGAVLVVNDDLTQSKDVKDTCVGSPEVERGGRVPTQFDAGTFAIKCFTCIVRWHTKKVNVQVKLAVRVVRILTQVHSKQ